jgi:hypothetical protein
VCRSEWYPSEKGWLACVQNYLYYRSPSIAPATCVVLRCSDLTEVGRVLQDGNGSLRSVVNTHHSSFAAENSDPLCRSPLFTDGRFLYILTSLSRVRYAVHIYDPLAAMQHLRDVELHNISPIGRNYFDIFSSFHPLP